MNTLEFVISLRQKGLDSAEIKSEMLKQGFEESEITSFMKKSDEIFLNQFNSKQIPKQIKKPSSLLKVIEFVKKIALALSLILLVAVLFGYIRTGILGIIILWSLAEFGSSRN